MAGNGPLVRGMATSKSLKQSQERRKGSRRKVDQERGGIPTGPSGAMSSFKALFFHDIPPEVLFALAMRYTVGHKKYGVSHVNINWKVGLNDPAYIADRFNHAMTHLISIMDHDLEEQDDHLGGAIWNVAFLITAKKRFPKAYKQAFVQGNLVAEKAKEFQDKLKELLK